MSCGYQVYPHVIFFGGHASLLTMPLVRIAFHLLFLTKICNLTPLKFNNLKEKLILLQWTLSQKYILIHTYFESQNKLNLSTYNNMYEE